MIRNLTDVTLSYLYFTFGQGFFELSYLEVCTQTDWNIMPTIHVGQVEITRLADLKQTPRSRSIADLSNVHF